MTPIAAYYVMIVTDHQRATERPRYDSPVPSTSRFERVVAALETLVRLGRPVSTQPV
jgi:hypothetical protein